MVMGGNGPCPVALMVSPGKRFKFILTKWRLYIIFSEREKDVCEMVLWGKTSRIHFRNFLIGFVRLLSDLFHRSRIFVSSSIKI